MPPQNCRKQRFGFLWQLMSMIKRYLIIDDVTDSGDTLRTAVGYVKGQGAREIKTGVFAA